MSHIREIFASSFIAASFAFWSTCALADNSYFDSGVGLLKAREYAKALVCFDHSVDTDPTNGNYHFWRGKCLGDMGKPKEATAEFRLAALLASDAKLKESCRAELARLNKPMPQGSVHDKPRLPVVDDGSNVVDAPDESATHSEKFFKLTSKKLEWNLEMRKDFLQSMNNRTENLGRLARGERWRMGAGVAPRGMDIRGALLEGPAHFNTPLSLDEKAALINSDIVLVLDHSGSMRTMDCPASRGGVEPRLLWCTEELEDFADLIANALPHGFHLITFDSKPDVFQITSASQLRQVLQSLTGGGGTDLAAALKEAFRLHTSHPKQPLLIAVITDAEIDVHSCEQTIVQATQQFSLPNGVFITLLQIGIVAEIHTADRLSTLDNLRSRSGAAYDAFFGIPFSQLRREGLARDLLVGLKTNISLPKPSPSVSEEISKTSVKGESGINPPPLKQQIYSTKNHAGALSKYQSPHGRQPENLEPKLWSPDKK